VTDVETIQRQGALWEAMNIGIAPGAESGVFVVDEDEPGALDALEARYGKLPETVAARSGSGRGRHLYLKHPGFKIGNHVKSVAAGIDLRGDGGFIVAPPSLHVSGGRYEWVSGRAPGEVPFAEAPEWFLDLIRGAGGGRRWERDPRLDEVEEGGAIHEGERNTVLFKYGASLRAQGYSREKIADALKRINDEQCEPGPLPDDELETIINSASGYDAGSDDDDDHRPAIQVVGGQLPRIVDDAEAALLAAGSGRIFQRTGVLVRLIRLPEAQAGGVRRPAGHLQAIPVRKHFLTEQFTRVANFQGHDGRKKEWRPVDCPQKVAEVYLERAGSWRVAELRAIVTAPTMRPDGTVLQAAGYDAETGIYFDPGDVTFPPVPEMPTGEEAL